ncbi:MAG: hypothetical protein ABIN24_06130 [Dyadobacter sp.]
MSNLITASQKDVLLDYLIEKVGLEETHEESKNENLLEFTPNEIKAMFNQFSQLGLIELKPGYTDKYRLSMKMAAHDFKLKGGFSGEELLFQNTVEKLLLEVEKLTPTDSEQQIRLNKIKENIKELISILTNFATIGTAIKDIYP